MKPFLKILFAFLCVIVLFAGMFPCKTIKAQNELLFGQNHYYSVLFRGNGEAIVYSKIVINNSENKKQAEFSFEVPKVAPYELVIFQQKLPLKCVKYEYKNNKCLEYGDPDYNSGTNYGYYGSDTSAEYKRIEYAKSGSLYKFDLPYLIEPYKSSALIVAYAAKGYVKKQFGLFKFDFETIKVPERINKTTVAVNVDSDLVLRGKKTQIKYKTDEFSSLESLRQESSISSKGLDSVVNKIGTSGSLVKEVSGLAPNESFIVRGSYADSWFRLYLGQIVLVIFIILTLFAGLYFLNRYLKRRAKSEAIAVSGEKVSEVESDEKPNITILDPINIFLGFLSAVLVIGFTYLLIYLSDLELTNLDSSPVMLIIGVIAIILFYILLIFGLAIFVVIRKRGWKSFGIVLVSEFLFLVFFLLIYYLYTSSISSGSGNNLNNYKYLE